MRVSTSTAHDSFLGAAGTLAGCCAVALAAVIGMARDARSQPAVADDVRTFTIGGGAFALEAPVGWRRVQPKSQIVETEFTIPAAADGEQPGRMTAMGAGGSVSDNVDRWIGQFSQPDGGSTKDKTVTKTLKIAGCTVTFVDVPGTYKDMPGGPFAGGKAIERPNYRMLAAIVETPASGNHFLKFYGPAAVVDRHADGFRTMVEGMVAAAR
ncbi:MAG: hypothetical protein EBZ59_05180 [Planctomycetia bacterium]|nr:hypothetical protein [Planctomycetia bacterium]